MKCPVCKAATLKTEVLEETLIAHRCTQCYGMWMPALEYWEWVQGRTVAEKELFNGAEVSLPVEETGKAKICPECGHILRRYKVWPNVKFYLDKCQSCNGVWFDQNEWEYLKAQGEHNHIFEFFGELWQEDIREEEVREYLEAMYLERFGAEDYVKVQDIRAWLWHHPQQGALIAYLIDKDPYRL